MKKLRLTQSRRAKGERQRENIRGLGLRGLQKSVLLENNPSIRGMIRKVIHLLKVEEVDV